MTTDADRLARAAAALERLYPDLFAPEASTRGQGGRERQSRNRNDPPGPSRVEVLDLQRAVNTAALERHCQALNTLGFGPAGPLDVRYRQSPRVLEALRFLASVAPSLAAADADLAADVAGELQALAAEARRLLGHTARAVPLGLACPADLGEVLEDDALAGQVCGGELVGLPAKGLVTCRGCGARWHHTDWEALGRAAAPPTPPPAEAA